MTCKITPCLWFDGQAEEAAKFYTSIFPNSKITSTQRFPNAGSEITGRQPGTVMTVQFSLDGQTFTALNGGPKFKFNEAVSLQVHCADQTEVDYFWEKLGDGGDPQKRQCGWLADKFGVSWQVVPKGMDKIMNSKEPEKAASAFRAMLDMKKLDAGALKQAFDGE